MSNFYSKLELGDTSEFPELKIETLRKRALEWAEKFPVIQKITLFRARSRENFKFLLYVEYDPNWGAIPFSGINPIL
ncbi:MAG: hypothetical protein DRH24_15170 [Deltaproteobacteria bacterium]|nr:MAG: hypothetical protein DRH24_15170 [Deltaproteobacteria bacterium]